VNAFALGAGFIALAVLMTIVATRWRRGRGTDLGAVSTQWVMEHRSGPGHDTNNWNRR